MSSRGGSALYKRVSDVSQIRIGTCQMLKLGVSLAQNCMQTYHHLGIYKSHNNCIVLQKHRYNVILILLLNYNMIDINSFKFLL